MLLLETLLRNSLKIANEKNWNTQGTTQHRLKLLGLILFTGASEGATEGVRIRARILQDALVTPPLYTFQEMLIPEACIILANYVISTEVLTEDTIFTSTTGDGTVTSRVVIQVIQRSNHFQGKNSTFISQLFKRSWVLVLPCEWYLQHPALQSSILQTELVLTARLALQSKPQFTDTHF